MIYLIALEVDLTNDQINSYKIQILTDSGSGYGNSNCPEGQYGNNCEFECGLTYFEDEPVLNALPRRF